MLFVIFTNASSTFVPNLALVSTNLIFSSISTLCSVQFSSFNSYVYVYVYVWVEYEYVEQEEDR